MDSFSQTAAAAASVGLSAGALSLGEPGLSSLTTELGEAARNRMMLGQAVLPWPAGIFSPGLRQQCRSTSSDMDMDLRDDRMGPLKLARIDYHHHHSPQPQHEADFRAAFPPASFVRTSSLLPDASLRCSPAASDGGLILCNDASFLPERRLSRSDSILSCPEVSSCRGMPSYHEAYPYRLFSGVLPPTSRDTLMAHFGLYENSRGSHGPFTANQIRELQHQALVFKYIRGGLSVPMELLLPLRSSFLGLSSMAAGAHQLASIGWGNYHVGYGNLDPEPGRCRRTDGKKWRCSRDVVPDQKYCERHMHRGRHRAKKGLESNQGNSSLSSQLPVAAAASAAQPSTLAMAAPRGTALSSVSSLRPAIADLNTQQNKLIPSPLPLKDYSRTNSPTTADRVTLGSSVAFSQFQLPFQSKTGTSCTAFVKDNQYFNGVSRLDIELGPEQMFSEPQTMNELSMFSWQTGLQSSKQQQQQQQQHSFLGESEGQPLRHFFDDWPQSRGGTAEAMQWVEMEEQQTNTSSSSAAKLTMSPQMGPSDFRAASRGSSPGGKLSLASLNLSMARVGEDEAAMVEGKRMGGMHEEQGGWNPMGSLGGPLGEALQSSSSNPREYCVASPCLNLMRDAWDRSPPSSPPPAG